MADRYVIVPVEAANIISAACEMMTRRLVEAGAPSPTAHDNELMGRMMATLRGLASRPPVDEVVKEWGRIIDNERDGPLSGEAIAKLLMGD